MKSVCNENNKICVHCDGAGITDDMSGGLIRDCPHCDGTGERL